MYWAGWLVAIVRTSALAFLLWGSFFLAGKYFSFYQRPLNQQIIIGAACLILCSVAYAYLTSWYYGWTYEKFSPRYHGVLYGEPLRRGTFFRTGVTTFCIISIMVGIVLLYGSAGASAFCGAFLCFTGAQVLLWRMGVSLEIIGNTAVPIDPPPAEVNEGE
ncbi:MAG TPA: hypothetical protein VK422_09070 [Pyrinomonadaceae bacterium]|nr:hypothetical protein [Pyrinomonadaceae bacterium]